MLIFEKKANSNWQLAASQTNPKPQRKNSFDKTVIRLLNDALMFVFNKRFGNPGWGWWIDEIADIARHRVIEKQNLTTVKHRF